MSKQRNCRLICNVYKHVNQLHETLSEDKGKDHVINEMLKRKVTSPELIPRRGANHFGIVARRHDIEAISRVHNSLHRTPNIFERF